MKTKLCLPLAFAALALAISAPLAAQNISPAAGSTNVINQGGANGFIMIGGKTYIVRQGVATPLDREVVLRITPTGVMGFDGHARTITNNAMMTMDGRIVGMPRGLTLAPAPTIERAVDPRLEDRGIYGQNISGLAPTRALPPPRALSTSRPLSSSGPRDIIAKKRTVIKSQKSSPPLVISTKKPSVRVRPPAPAFNDDTIPLPNRSFNQDGSLSGSIDAETTMLSMTTAAPPEPPASPPLLVPSLSASLGLGIDSIEELKTPVPSQMPPLPQTLVPIPTLSDSIAPLSPVKITP